MSLPSTAAVSPFARSVASIALLVILWSHPVIGQVTGDASLLRTIAERCAENDARIISWRGKAEIVDTNTDTESGAVVLKGVATVSFRYSSDGNRLFFDKQARVTEGDQAEKSYRFACLRTRDSFYRYGPLFEDDDRLRAAVRPQPLNAESKTFLSDGFDPLVFNKVELATQTVTQFANFYYAKRDSPNLIPISVKRQDSLVEITGGEEPESPTAVRWKYQFALNQAGLPVNVEGGSESGMDSVSRWQNSFVEIDGIWLPEKLVFTLNDRKHHQLHSRVTSFSEHQMNERIDESEFSMASLPLRKGDKVMDPVTGAWSTFGIEAKKPGPPVDMPVIPEEKFSLRRILLLVNLGIVVVFLGIACGRKWLHSSRNRK
jgi:hypothetical protein